MSIPSQINDYINSQPGPKRSDMEELHGMILNMEPGVKLWFLDGKDAENKTVSNPNVGYGHLTMQYKDGSSREFYRVGMSANTTGISLYIMGIDDRNYLRETYGNRLGKATVTGYCIKFKALKDVDINVLAEAIRFGFNNKE